MKRFWVRRSDGRHTEVNRELKHREWRFATGNLGEIDSRYALELAIDLLSRDDRHFAFPEEGPTSGPYRRP